jgi:hypothetical protein
MAMCSDSRTLDVGWLPPPFLPAPPQAAGNRLGSWLVAPKACPPRGHHLPTEVAVTARGSGGAEPAIVGDPTSSRGLVTMNVKER